MDIWKALLNDIGGDILKKTKLIVLVVIILFSGCANESTNTTETSTYTSTAETTASETSEIK